MADGFIVRKGGGVATEQALAPTITQVATTETSITFTITNNDAETAIIRHRLDDITNEGVIVELATNATSANITVTTLAAGTEFTVFATANVTGKVKSNVTQLAISTNEIPAPTITLVSKTSTSVTFTLKNNSVETRDVTFGLTTPPTTTTISLASDATSGNQTFGNLDSETAITIFAQAEGGLIAQLNVTTEPANYTAATGGTTLEYNSGGKRFKSHTFTSDGNFVVSTVGDNIDDRNKVNILVIAGGGGGGSNIAGGGGAGGFRTSDVVVTATTFGVVVGAGGNAGASQLRGDSGVNSSVLGVTSTGGGGGAGNDSTAAALTGGSGGGGSLNNNSGASGNAGSFNPAEGFAGGNGQSATFGSSGGGGGASQVGQNASALANTGGGGGNGGANTFRNGTSETRGGGGGGGRAVSGTSSAAPGGTGGGGNGGFGTSPNNATQPTAGAANTGGGGGGAGWGSAELGRAGGSGIVVIRYEIEPVV